jgi:V/A-type H+/Na+-transporting ATPase subunit I
MLTPKPMSRLLIVASREHMDDMIREMYSHRVFHIDAYVEGRDEELAGVTIGSPLGGAGEASAQLIKIRSMESLFGFKSEELVPLKRRPSTALRATFTQDLSAISREVDDLVARKAECEVALKDHEQQMKELAPFATAPMDLDLYRGYERFAVFTGRVPNDIEISAPHEKFFASSKEGSFIAVFTPAEYKNQVERQLQENRFVALPVPKGDGRPLDLLNMHAEKAKSTIEELTRISQRMEEIKKQQAEFLAACEELLETDVEQAEAPLRFAVTDQAFIAEGWVPIEEAERLKAGISLATGGKALVSVLPDDPHHPAPAPVEYDNPPFARPAQFLTDLYSRPRYDELDPTLLLSIIFPIFFGIILGDVGYGAILLVVSLALRKFLTSTEGRWLLTNLRNASISSIIFGVLFSEFFGFELPWHPFIFARHLNIGAHGEGGGPDITGLLMFAIWIGILQITLGRLLNGINHYRHHGIKGLIPQLGWISSMWGTLIVILSMFPMPLMPDLTGFAPIIMGLSIISIIGIVLLLAGIVAIATESALELVEFPTIISHTMSYARLAAVGLSSVAIAMVVNLIAIDMLIEPQLEQLSAVGIVFIILGVVVLIFGHLGNTALGLVGGGLQSLRLQYVEFFTKFYRGGGVKYSPFGKLRKFTED